MICVQPCRLPRKVLEVQVVDKNEDPVAGVAVSLRKGNSEIRDVTDGNGVCRFIGLDGGAYQITPSELDADVWVLLREEPLQPDTEDSSPAAWQSIEPPASTEHEHDVVHGDGLSSIAYRFGFLPSTVANHASNPDLLEKRENLETLLPGDTLAVPERRVKLQAASTGSRYVIKRLDIPSRITVRFLDADGNPRAACQFQVEFTTSAGDVLPMIEGQTDSGGSMTLAVPPDAATGSIRLMVDMAMRQYELRIGHLDPSNDVSGIQNRLRNLGLLAGEITGELDEATAAALEMFERLHGLEVTGRAEGATRAALLAEHIG
jgi:N-acetylmuramoyl-L-alanine amidase